MSLIDQYSDVGTEGSENYISTESNNEAISKPEQKPLDDIDQLLEHLKGVDGAPERHDLEMWQEVHNKFHVSSILADGDTYIWRTLKRGEYKQIMRSGAEKDEDHFAAAIVRKCLLYPEPDSVWMQKTSAGTIPTLQKQIMHYSGFIPDGLAISMVKVI